MSVMSLARPPRLRARAPVFPRLASGLLALALAASAIIAREWRMRRDMRRLSEFSDDMLRDIGVTRMDIDRVVRDGRNW